ncbi:MAG: hypothetical protein AB7F41_05870 [Methylocystis sp.]|uniref:hypothetical protein n=1 Tax=Methylocystis sp. TaxID=1911079 RepID=UPI003D09BA51
MDELAIPNLAMIKNGDDPSGREIEFPAEFSKRITEKLGVSFGSSYLRCRAPAGLSAGDFQNLETAVKYQFLTDAPSELVMSAGVSVLWGNIGNPSIDADKFTVVTPTLWFAKGLNDLPDALAWARPFGISGQIGYEFATWRRTLATSVDPSSGDVSLDVTRHPQFLSYGATLQYSLSYLESKVANVGLPDMIRRLVPIIETQFSTPVGNNFQTGLKTTGTINPGVFWVGDSFQIGAEAIIPINRASGSSVGWIIGVDFYLHEIFSDSPLGRPIFGESTVADTRYSHGSEHARHSHEEEQASHSHGRHGRH